MIIHLNGFPGVGKYTVAKELQILLNNSRIVDNHVVTNAVLPIADRGTEDYGKLTTIIRKTLFNYMSSMENTNHFILTHAMSADAGPRAQVVYDDVVNLAKNRNDILIDVALICSDESELLSRVNNKDRVSRMKLSDPKILKEIIKGKELFNCDKGISLKYDTSKHSPKDIANMIAAEIKSL